MTHRRHRILSVLLATGALVGLSGCEPGVDGSPQEAAEAVAAAIVSGDFSRTVLTDDTPANAQAQRESAYADVAEVPLRTDVLDVERDGDLPRAAGTLRLTWDLPGEGEDLTIDVPMRMKISEGAWAVAWEHGLLGVPRGQVLELEETPPQRADIVDRHGEALVTERAVWRFGVDKTLVEGPAVEEAARSLAAAADLDEDGYAASVEAAGPKAFVELITYRQGDQAGARLREEIDSIEGAVAIEEQRMLGPTRTFAQPLLGTVGPVTAEMVEKEPDRYEAGDVAGLSGLSAAFDEELSGTSGLRVLAVDEQTRAEQEVLLERDAGRPHDLQLTLDSRLQRIAESALAEVKPASALVAVDHRSGEVLAMANGPGSQGVDTALAAQYPPGSTFKLASALVLLREGMTPESTVTCEPTLDVDGYRFNNVPGYPDSALGEITLATALAHSCNTALIGEREQIPMDELAQAGTDLGLGAVWEMPVPAFSGLVPQQEQSETDHAASLIGQGRVLASPAAMAAFAASVAHGGPVALRVIAGQEVPQPEGELTEVEAEALRSMMRQVVTEGGASMLADNPGPPVLAKTGTAEFGEQSPPQTHVWMIAIQGDVAVSVFVEEGEFGSTTAGPIMDDFLTEIARQ